MRTASRNARLYPTCRPTGKAARQAEPGPAGPRNPWFTAMTDGRAAGVGAKAGLKTRSVGCAHHKKQGGSHEEAFGVCRRGPPAGGRDRVSVDAGGRRAGRIGADDFADADDAERARSAGRTRRQAVLNLDESLSFTHVLVGEPASASPE